MPEVTPTPTSADDAMVSEANRLAHQSTGEVERLREALSRVITSARFEWLGRDVCNSVRAALAIKGGEADG